MSTRYATRQDIEDEFGEENVKGWLGLELTENYSADQLAYIDRCINYAEERVDAALKPACVTPLTGDSLTSMSGMLREWVVDIAAARLYTRRSTMARGTGGEGLKDRVDAAIADFKAIRAGEYQLPDGVSLQSQFAYGHSGTETQTSDYLDKDFKRNRILT